MSNKTLGEEMQDRLNDPVKPDKYTLAWWNRRFDEVKHALRGALHNISTATASIKDCWAELKQQREAHRQLKIQLDDAYARIGELSAEVTSLSERIQRMADWAKQKDN